jgi:hypothetical protein
LVLQCPAVCTGIKSALKGRQDRAPAGVDAAGLSGRSCIAGDCQSTCVYNVNEISMAELGSFKFYSILRVKLFLCSNSESTNCLEANCASRYFEVSTTLTARMHPEGPPGVCLQPLLRNSPRVQPSLRSNLLVMRQQYSTSCCSKMHWHICSGAGAARPA